jgi:uncharacterized protein YndB with AHSA1/START domain
MTSVSHNAVVQAAVVVTRTYRATPEELWGLWTTKAGFESWWGPQGFRSEVHGIDAELGGVLAYDMIADAPEAIAAMRDMGRPLSHKTKGRFSAYWPYERLSLTHMIDFIPGQPPYETVIDVDFYPEGEMTRMVVTLHPHLDPNWTRMSAEGFGSQLTKLDARYGWNG